MDAPLSSPAQTQTQRPGFQTSYFSNASSTSSSAPKSTSQASTSTAPPSSQPQQQHVSHSYQTNHQQAYQAQAQQQNQGDKASNFLQDFSLVAEAAKRAQLAVLMRDMEAVGI